MDEHLANSIRFLQPLPRLPVHRLFYLIFQGVAISLMAGGVSDNSLLKNKIKKGLE